MECRTFSHIDNGIKIFKDKIRYDTLDEAIIDAKILNNKEGQLHKAVSYKCKVCFKYHVGRTERPVKKRYF